MESRMDADAIVERLLENPAALHELGEPLPDEVAGVVVERLKAEADRHWAINANRSLEFAELIVQIGEARGDQRQIALGIMARGDALKLLGRNVEAWEALETAGEMFLSIGDEVGWARTRIGKLLICVDLNRVNEALEDAEQARSILSHYKMFDRRLVLDLNTAIVYDLLGKHHESLDIYTESLKAARSLGIVGEQWIGPLYTNIGLSYSALGNFQQAAEHHELARKLFLQRGEISGAATAEINLAHLAIGQGHYKHALALLHTVYELVAAELPQEAAHVQQDMIECYLFLNRFSEASKLARDVSIEFRKFGASYEEAITLLHLATAEAALQNFNAALTALNSAERIFTSLNAEAWVATIQLRQSRIAIRQGDIVTAKREAAAAAAHFKQNGQQVKHATAMLLQGQSSLFDGQLQIAKEPGHQALAVAQRCNVPDLRYSAHLLLGRIAEAQGDQHQAILRYRAAAATVDRVQRGLTITLRPGFLEDKAEALNALLALYLRSNDGQRAFETLERAKSQVLLGYLANREQLHWANEDPRSKALLDELQQLRAEHQWLYETAHDRLTSDDQRRTSMKPEQAMEEVAVRERRMRALTEQLYLLGDETATSRRVSVPNLAEIQRNLNDDAVLIEYYNDGDHIWAFTIDREGIVVHPLPATRRDIDQILAQLQVNLQAALKAGSSNPSQRALTKLGQRLLQRLYNMLIAPFAHHLDRHHRLIVVPYGVLHYLPFHLLHTGTEYLLDRHEIVILPTAGLLTQRGPTRDGGARVLAHSWNGRLSQTLAEAELVHALFDGNVYNDESARRSVFETPPTQVLHIAAHGEHRLDQPDLSYIQLADGQLYTDDLLQHDLSYELVTLSACETGRARVAAGDELIGIGRGFLYAGAGALIVSLWQVDDEATIAFMQHLYRHLHKGASKVAALRHAQRAVRASKPDLHPAFWGAFQLIGDPRPLSTWTEQKEAVDELHTIGATS
jgi:CHAT domain-containing protein/tetratricopeptide (TPR) repeat protein